jgi:pimeloyl-ACP methyl ester carboxylesterase
LFERLEVKTMTRMEKYLTIIILAAVCALILACNQQSSYREVDITFSNTRDGIPLAGTLTLPKGPGPFPAVVLVTGSGPHERDVQIGKHRIMFTLADYLARNGIASIRYDKRGCGKSGGKYEPHDIDAFTEDALSAVSFLASNDVIESEWIGAIGLSQGGLIVPKVAVHSMDVRFIVLMAAPGVWGKEFACVSSIAIARACGYGEEDFARIGELYDELWPLYTQPQLSTSETREAKQLLAEIARFMDSESRKILNLDDINGYFWFMRSHHVFKSMDDNPADVLKQVKCPVLAVTGSKDVQIPAKEHLPAIENALREGGNRACKVAELEGLNHVFQKCHTGLPIEYLTSKESMAPEALKTVTNWILEITASSRSM